MGWNFMSIAEMHALRFLCEYYDLYDWVDVLQDGSEKLFSFFNVVSWVSMATMDTQYSRNIEKVCLMYAAPMLNFCV